MLLGQLLVDSYLDSLYSDEVPSESVPEVRASWSIVFGVVGGMSAEVAVGGGGAA